MIAKTSFKLGDATYNFEFDEKDEMDTLNKIITLSNPPKYCHECKNNEFFAFDTNKDKEGNTYVNVRCTKCNAKAKLGQYKTGGYFWHKFVKFQGKGGDSSNVAEPQKSVAEDEVSPDDIPF